MFSAIPLVPADSVTVGAAMLPVPVTVMPVGVLPAAPPIVTLLADTAPVTLSSPVSDRLNGLPVTAKPPNVPIALEAPASVTAPPVIPPMLVNVPTVNATEDASLTPPVLSRSSVPAADEPMVTDAPIVIPSASAVPKPDTGVTRPITSVPPGPMLILPSRVGGTDIPVPVAPRVRGVPAENGASSTAPAPVSDAPVVAVI